MVPVPVIGRSVARNGYDRLRTWGALGVVALSGLYEAVVRVDPWRETLFPGQFGRG